MGTAPDTLGGLLRAACARYANREAIRARGGSLTYAELLTRSARLANALRGKGLPPGAHVAAMLEDRLHALEVYVAGALGGYPVVHVNDRLAPGEVAYILEDSGARALVHTDGLTPKVAEVAGIDDLLVVTMGDDLPTAGACSHRDLVERAAADVPPETRVGEDLAIIGYTSGTTGFPKGAMASHQALVTCTRLVPSAYRFQLNGRCAFTGTLSFASGIWGVILPHLYTGGRIDFLAPYTVESWVDHIARERSTFTYAPSPLVPGLAAEARKRPEALQSLRSVLHSAAPLPRAHAVELVDAIGPRLVEVWGMTESVGPVTATVAEDYEEITADDVYSCVGRPLPTSSVWASDDDANRLPAGETGELVVSADTLFSGYWNRAEATDEVLVDGVYRTGDVGHVDAAGYVYVTGRRSDLIISGGMNVYPTEVEATLVTLPGVLDVAVFGVPNERYGEAVAAAVVKAPGAELDEAKVIDHVRSNMASYKKPGHVMFVEALPRNASLKVQKHVLRTQFAS